MEFPERNLGFLLHDVARLMRKRFEQNARELGLTRSQCSVLAHLARNEGIQQGGLAEILEVEPCRHVPAVDGDAQRASAGISPLPAFPAGLEGKSTRLFRPANPLFSCCYFGRLTPTLP